MTVVYLLFWFAVLGVAGASDAGRPIPWLFVAVAAVTGLWTVFGVRR